jgi:hypothetical protein
MVILYTLLHAMRFETVKQPRNSLIENEAANSHMSNNIDLAMSSNWSILEVQ